MMPRKVSVFGAVICVSLLSAGCDPIEALNALRGTPAPKSVDEAKKKEPAAEQASDVAKRAKANAETLKELYEVVFMQSPKDRAEFGNYVDTMNQGASIEGLYNGFLHSSGYRKLEVVSGEAPAEVVKAFSQELAHLEALLPVSTHFDENSARPLPVMAANELAPAVVEFSKDEEGPANKAAPAKPDEAELAQKYQKIFKGASVFTLKRVLGDEAMKAVAALRQANEFELVQWYANWVTRMAAKNVDFGLALRNKVDEQFHANWAKSASADRLQWEVLNRLHRVMNDVYRKNTGAAATAAGGTGK